MNNPKVCVVMPVYNGASTIEFALKSLLAQTYKNWICVIVNDGSNDNTKQILDSLLDPRFKVYHLPKNMGRGYARQFALEHAEGDFLTYLDADDFFHTEKIEKQVSILLKDNDLDLVSTEVLIFGNNYEPTGKRVKKNKSKTYFKMGDKLPISMATAMIKIEKAKKIVYNSNLNASEDIDYFSRYLDGGYYIQIAQPYYYYFVSEKNTPYKKILSYTFQEIKRGYFIVFDYKKIYGFKVLFKGIIKWLIYAVALPIMGENFFLKRRNVDISIHDKKTYNNEFFNIKNTILS